MRDRRRWRCGLLALYVVATLIAALLPEGMAVARPGTPAAAPAEPVHQSMIGHAMHGHDHAGGTHDAGAPAAAMNTALAGHHHNATPSAPSAPDRVPPDPCGVGSLCTVLHTWIPTSLATFSRAVPTRRHEPVAVALPRGIDRAPDLRPPLLSA